MKSLEAMNSKQLTAACVGLCLAVTAGAWFLGVEPFLGWEDQLGQDRAELVTVTTRRDATQRSLERVENELREAREELANCKLQLESRSQANRRFAELGELARASGLRIDSILPGRAYPQGAYDLAPIDIHAEGGYPLCVEFLDRVQGSFPDTDLHAMEVSAKGPDGVTRTKIRLVWYTAPPGQVARRQADRPRLGTLTDGDRP